MQAVLKTLFGDTRNVVVVAGLVALEFALVHSGLSRTAVFLIPVVTIAGIAWLAPR